MFILPDLPYPSDALQPVMSAETLRFHHGKHHKAYVDALNRLLQEQGADPGDLETVVREAAGDAARTKLFNNAAQAWNHGFLWDAMTPGRQAPDGDLAAAIDSAFGGLAGLKASMVRAGVDHFGSGWVWLVAEGDRLRVVATHDAANPLTLDGAAPLMVCDLWEHAYYRTTGRASSRAGSTPCPTGPWPPTSMRPPADGGLRGGIPRQYSRPERLCARSVDKTRAVQNRLILKGDKQHAEMGAYFSGRGADRRVPRLWRTGRHGRRHRQDPVLRLPGAVLGLGRDAPGPGPRALTSGLPRQTIDGGG